jgi:hypothetical protein
MTAYELLLDEIRVEFPRFSVVPKVDSRFMRFLAVLLRPLLGGAFMGDYTTTLGQTVYTPVDWAEMPEASRLEILRHERVHLRQARRWGLLFSLAYLLFPLPLGLAWCRARFEWEAYEESMRAKAEYQGKESLDERHKAWLVGLFVGPSYGFMWPFRAQVSRWYDEARARILAGG